MKRAQNKIRRVLTLIDILAPLRMPFTIQDVIHRLEEKNGGRVDVCARTIRRDMELLISMNFAEVYRQCVRGTRGAGAEPTQYKMNLRMTERAEVAAIKVSEALPLAEMETV